MSKKEKHIGLSSEDAALWEKVTKTMSDLGPKKKGKKLKEASSANEEKDLISKSEQQETETEFETLLNEKEQKAKAATVQSEEVSQELSSKKTPKKNTPKIPTREDFEALLDDPKAVISTDKKLKKQGSLTDSDLSNKSAIKKQTPKPKPKIESFSHKDARNISSGKQTIDAAIDLHGLTQAQAETALKTFLKRAHQDQKKTVLVITGKGQRRKSRERSFELGAPEPGILKRSVPGWLDDMPDIVLSYRASHIKHGGEGALYVRLRRAK